MVTITYLKQHPKYVPLLAHWSYSTWGKYNPSASLEIAVQKFTEHLNDDHLPLTYIALDENKPVGTCSLREVDGVKSEHSPWLGSLYVVPEYRGQGIGEKLISTCLQKAHGMGYAKLYLLTFELSLSIWYERLGWKLIGDDTLNGFPVHIMEYFI